MAKAKKTNQKSKELQPLIFTKQNYIWMAIGLAFVLLGLGLMTGGSMSSPEVWDESAIYSTRRTLIAPIVILIGFSIEVYAIFKR